MATKYSPRIVRNGLVLCLDAGAVRSYDPSTNSGTELVANGTMEADSNWANYNSPTTNERSSTQAKAGTYSRKFVADSTYDGIKSDTFTTVANKVYIVSAWIYADDQTKVHIQLLDGDESSGTGHNQNTNHTVAQDAWTYLEIPISVSTGGSSSRVTFQSASGATTGTWYIDQVSVREKSVWYDLSGNFNDGAMSSVIQTAESGAGGTKSFDFDGTSDYVNIEDSSLWDATGGISVSCWCYADSLGSYNTTVNQWDSSANSSSSWTVETVGSDWRFYIYDSGSTALSYASSTGTATTGAWKHIVGVFDGTTVKVYVDGVVGGTTDTVTTANTASFPLRIGRFYDTATGSWNGKIAIVHVYNRTLSAAEIQQNYNAQKGRFGK